MLVHELLESSARERPEALALLTGTGATTYGELDALATQFARVCVARNTPGDRVAIALENSIELDCLLLWRHESGRRGCPLARPEPAAIASRGRLLTAGPRLSVVDEATFTLTLHSACGLTRARARRQPGSTVRRWRSHGDMLLSLRLHRPLLAPVSGYPLHARPGGHHLYVGQYVATARRDAHASELRPTRARSSRI